MKRVGYLYEKIYQDDNLELALKNAIRGTKRRRKDVQFVLEHKDETLLQIKESLENSTYSPKKYKHFKFVDSNSKKIRDIYKPNIIDHITQWAIIQTLQPYIYRGMDRYSCCNIKYRGTLYAKETVEKYVRNDDRGTRYCLKMDIYHYFENIDVDLLLAKLCKIFKDDKVINLLSIITHSQQDVIKGLPIGTLLSQTLANFYLQDLDHYIRENLHCKYYVRYMDDLVILGSNKRKLHHILDDIKKYLETQKLELKDNYQVFKVAYTLDGKILGRPIDFAGYKIYRDHTTLRKHIFKKVRRMSLRLSSEHSNSRYKRLVSYLGYIKHSDSKYITLKYISKINKLKNILFK